MADLKIVSDPRAAESADATFVRESLALYNVATTGHSYYSPLAIFLRDDRGAVLGGGLGHVWGGWLDLDAPSGCRSCFAGWGTGRNYSRPPKKRQGPRDATAST